MYTLHGGTKQENTSVRVQAEISGLKELLEQNAGKELEAARDVAPGRSVWLLAVISLGCTAGAAIVTILVMRLYTKLRKRRKAPPKHHK